MRHRLPPQLLRTLLDGNVLLFLGPQVVEDETLPQDLAWSHALAAALRLGVTLREAEELEAFLQRASPMELAQAARLQLGQEAYLQLTEALVTPGDTLPPPIVYALRALPPRTWFTTNTDTLLERAFVADEGGESALRVVRTGPGDDRPLGAHVLGAEGEERPRALVKLFGDAQAPEALVLGTDDYETYWRRRPGLAGELTELLEGKVPLFVGYDLKDPAFLRLYSLIGPALGAKKRRAFAFVADATAFDTLWWNRRSLRILPLEGGDALEGALREAAAEVRVHRSPGVPVESEESPLAQSPGSEPLTQAHAILEAQLSWALESWLVHPPGEPLDLHGAYVPRRLDPETADPKARETRLRALLADGSPEGRARLEDPRGVSIQTLLAQGGRVLITGPSGAGKTTLLLNLLRHFALGAMDEGSRTLAFYLPLSYLTPVEWDPEPDLIGRLTAHLIRLVSHVTPDSLRQTIEHALEEDRAILLLDGLDEVHPDDIPAVREVLERLRRLYRDANIILTCRSDRWTPDLLPDLPVYGLLPLSDEDAGALIQGRLGEDAAPLLSAALAAGALPFAAQDPLTLALSCDHFRLTGALPRDLPDLLESHLQLTHRAGKVGEGDVLAGEAVLAAQAVAAAVLGEPSQPLTAEHLGALLLKSVRGQELPKPEEASRRLLDTLRQGSGLLVGPSIQGTFAFRHQRLLEHLAARHLEGGRAKDPTRGNAGDPRWQGVWPLLAPALTDSTPLLRALEKAPSAPSLLPQVAAASQSFKLKWILGKVTDDQGEAQLGAVLESLKAQLRPSERLDLYEAVLVWDREHFETDGSRIDGRLVWAAIRGLQGLITEEGPSARAASATLASWRGERPRGRKGPWPQEVARIEGGLSLYGQEGRRVETRFITLPDVYLALTPVTMGLWRTFHPSFDLARATGHAVPGVFLEDAHPAVGMTYFDAAVCAAWFGGRLPSEAEWDKAAAWNPQTERRRAFPWGDAWDPSGCNTLETWKETTGITTPVDQFGEAGASAYGCLDMAGNVLEWTAGDDGPEGRRRILRGGSWMAAADYARCGARVLLSGDLRSTGVGLRLAFDQSTD